MWKLNGNWRVAWIDKFTGYQGLKLTVIPLTLMHNHIKVETSPVWCASRIYWGYQYWVVVSTIPQMCLRTTLKMYHNIELHQMNIKYCITFDQKCVPHDGISSCSAAFAQFTHANLNYKHADSKWLQDLQQKSITQKSELASVYTVCQKHPQLHSWITQSNINRI